MEANVYIYIGFKLLNLESYAYSSDCQSLLTRWWVNLTMSLIGKCETCLVLSVAHTAKFEWYLHKLHLHASKACHHVSSLSDLLRVSNALLNTILFKIKGLAPICSWHIKESPSHMGPRVKTWSGSMMTSLFGEREREGVSGAIKG